MSRNRAPRTPRPVSSDDLARVVRLRMQLVDGSARRIRLAAGLTQRDIAAAIGRTNEAVSQYEAGRRMPNRETSLKLAEVLDKVSAAAGLDGMTS